MYDNIGEKLKGLAKASCLLGTIGGIISGIYLMIDGSDEGILIGFFVIMLSFFVAWISSWWLYGLGEIVDMLADMRRNASGEKSKSTVTTVTSFVCGKCGHQGPYEGNCPECGSSLKKYK